MSELRFSEYCANCRRRLEGLERVLFVEKELGRCFCSEECIQDYFSPMVDQMAEQLAANKKSTDIPDEAYSKFAHYRTLTLEDPDEIWLEVTETGENHFTYIAHYRNGDERFSYVVVCLALEGVPSFVFLSFPTKDDDLVDTYRKGRDLKIELARDTHDPAVSTQEAAQRDDDAVSGESSDISEPARRTSQERLQHAAVQLEGYHRDLHRTDDVPIEMFTQFEEFVEPTIDDRDEIWHFQDENGDQWSTFLSKHSADLDGNVFDFVMIVVARLSGSVETAFFAPTVDVEMVQHFRKGINSLNKAFGLGWTRGRAA